MVKTNVLTTVEIRYWFAHIYHRVMSDSAKQILKLQIITSKYSQCLIEVHV